MGTYAIAALVAVFLFMLVRGVVVTIICLKRPKTLTEREPSGFQKQNWLRYQVWKFILLPIIYWPGQALFRRFPLKGKSNLRLAEKLRKEGKRIVLVMPHDSSTNTFEPLFLFWVNDFHQVTDDIFWPVNLEYVNRSPFWYFVQTINHIPVVTDRIIKAVARSRKALSKNEYEKQKERIRLINRAAASACQEQLARGKWCLVFPEGTRNQALIKVNPTFLELLGWPDNTSDLVIVPVITLGSWERWQPHTPLLPWKLFGKVTTVVGRPFEFSDMKRVAEIFAKEFTQDLASDLIMKHLARLYEENGRSDLTGYYSEKPIEEALV